MKQRFALMRRALALAAKGMNTTTPNPRVGCVIAAANGDIVGEGWHRQSGEAHAEVIALAEAGDAARGATVFVTMEPCVHRAKKTPPCAAALIAAQVGKVAAAMADPNPLVSGGGFAALAAAGIAVETGVLQAQARELNLGYASRMIRGRPWLRLKIAATMDGRTALAGGLSEWISGEESRRDAHRLRARSCAVITGVGTALQDNPRLTARDVKAARQPLRVLVDSRLRALGRDLHLFRQDAETLIAAATNVGDATGVAAATGVADATELKVDEVTPPIVVLPAADGKTDLRRLLAHLGRRGCNEATVEAGARLNGAFLAAGLVDEIVVYSAGKIFGADARPCFDFLPPPSSPQDAPRFVLHSLKKIGGDVKAVWRASDFDSFFDDERPAGSSAD